jgi:hypothetical protein
MADKDRSPSESGTEDRRQTILDRRLVEQVNDLEERIGRDPALALQLVVDPLDTLSRFGLMDSDTKDLEVRCTQGSFLDVIQLRKAIESRGIANILAQKQDVPTTALARTNINVVITIRFCVTICWRGVCVTICVSGTLAT